MIDITSEQLIPIRDVPGRLPPTPKDKRIHISAVYRWMRRGVRGARLESIRIGGFTYTSIEALQRFADRLSEPRHNSQEPRVTTITRQKQIERAEREVREILGGGQTKKQSN